MKIINGTKGFSLVEVLVVLAIIGTLAGVAIPVYQTYAIRARVADGFRILNQVRDQLIAQYERTGTWPSSFSMFGVTINDNASAVVNIGPVKNLAYHGINTATQKGVYLGGSLSGLTGIPGYIAPTTGETSRSVIRVASFITPGTSVFRTHCGIWQPGDTNDVGPPYIPATCTCTAMINSYNGSPTC